jgi:hypothetical protein
VVVGFGHVEAPCGRAANVTARYDGRVLEAGSEVRAALVAVPAGLLVAAGAAKLAGAGDRDLRAALAAIGLPRRAARPLAVAELGIGLGCLAWPHAAALAAMAVAYLGFAAVTAVRRLRHDARPCGCLWDDGSPGWLHVAVDLAACGLAAACAAAPPPSLVGLAGAHPALALPLALGVGCAVFCTILVLQHLPAAMAAYAPGQELR